MTVEPTLEQIPEPTPQLRLDPATPADLEALAAQLGRTPRGVVAIAARCVCGAPAVVATAPHLPDGTPFPTNFYLTLPSLVKAASTLEAGHYMEELNQRLADDAELATAYAAAHDLYLRQRRVIAQAGGCHEVPEIENVSAGGMPTRVKCLHALVGHALASGPGGNPIGDIALAELAARGLWEASKCYCEAAAGRENSGSKTEGESE